jgi:hypothetical protein
MNAHDFNRGGNESVKLLPLQQPLRRLMERVGANLTLKPTVKTVGYSSLTKLILKS